MDGLEHQACFHRPGQELKRQIKKKRLTLRHSHGQDILEQFKHLRDNVHIYLGNCMA